MSHMFAVVLKLMYCFVHFPVGFRVLEFLSPIFLIIAGEVYHKLYIGFSTQYCQYMCIHTRVYIYIYTHL